MLDSSTVYASFPSIPGVFKRAVLREYLQYKSLQYIFRCRAGAGLVFLGGTALRIFHSSGRFSEDLDFDSGELDGEDLEEIALRVIDEFAREGVACSLSFGKGKAFSAKLKFTEILQRWGLTGHNDEVLTLKFDAAPQHYSYKAEIRILNRLDVVVPVPVTPCDLLLSQKLYAIINRRRVMGRDIYDASYLFGLTKPDVDYLSCKLNASSSEEVGALVLSRLEEIDIDYLAEDVSAFVADRNDLLRIRLFPQILREWMDESKK